jgi:branched-chain amino acid transport system substrate-binding protein
MSRRCRSSRPGSSRPRPAAILRTPGGTARVAAAVLAAGVLAAACSSSGGGTSSSSGGGTSGSSSKSTYVIGNITSETGTYASSTGGTFPTIDAWTRWTNAHGGINGHPVKVITVDDGGIPANGIAAAKTLIADHVMAIVGPVSNTEFSWYTMVTGAKIPVIGGQTNGGPLYQATPLLFPTGETSTVGLLSVAGTNHHPKIAVMYCSEVPACAAQTTAFKSQAAAHASSLGGVKLVYSAAVSGSAPSYTAQCLAAKQAGANAMFVSDSAAIADRVFKDCASQGYTPMPLGYAPSVDDSWLGQPSFDGAYITEENFPWFASSTPTEIAFHSAIKQYDPALLKSITFNANTSQVWAALEVYKAVMLKANAGDSPTPQKVIDALYSLPAGWSVAGVTPPLTFARDKPNPPVDCYFLVQIKNKNWTVAADGKVTCPA